MKRSTAAILANVILVFSLFGLAGVALAEPAESGDPLLTGCYVPPPASVPVVTGVSPAEGPIFGGTEVVITGTGFTNAGEGLGSLGVLGATADLDAAAALGCSPYGVTFGGVPAKSFRVESDTQIIAVSPCHAVGTVQVQVRTAAGASADNDALDDFTYVPAEAIAPVVTGLSPDTGPTGGGTKVIITGTGFYAVGESFQCETEGVPAGCEAAGLGCSPSGVTFDGVPAKSFTVKSSTEIWAYSPAHDVGVVQVQVTTPGGTSTNTDGAADFEYYQADLKITGLDPQSGPSEGGTKVHIYGSGFYQVGEGLLGVLGTGVVAEGCSGNGVTFGGVPALSYTVYSDTLIKAIAPAHDVGTVQVQVNTALGSTADVPEDDYTYDVTFTSIRGDDRYWTALKISQKMFPTGLPEGSGLVLAPGDSYQEALCGAPLAAAFGGPVLITPKAILISAVRAEIIRLQPQYVICIGLSDAIKNAVQTALGATGVASVIRGADVYEMSYKVAMALGAKVGDMTDAVAIITRGDVFADAIVVPPLACFEQWPILLTDGATGSLNTWAVKALTDLGITKAIKVGTYCTLPDWVTGMANLSGNDRYYTNRNFAEWCKNVVGLTFKHAGMTTGDKFPDALCSGPYMAKDMGILLLSPLYGPLPACIKAEYQTHAGTVGQTSFFGMLDSVMNQVKALVP